MALIVNFKDELNIVKISSIEFFHREQLKELQSLQSLIN